MVSYKILYDEVQDAYNWYSAIVKFGQMKKLKSTEDLRVANQIQNLDFPQAKAILVPYIQKMKKAKALEFQKIMTEQLAKYFEPAIKKLEKVTGHPLAVEDCAENRKQEIAKIDSKAKPPKEDLLFLITTFPAMIVYYAEGVIYTYAKIDQELWGMPLDGILHELMHFQTDYYYRENPDSPVAKLNEDEYYVLKESLPVLLDESWKPMISLPDCSYSEFKPLREKLHNFYQQNQDFDRLMEFGAKEVKELLQNEKIVL